MPKPHEGDTAWVSSSGPTAGQPTHRSEGAASLGTGTEKANRWEAGESPSLEIFKPRLDAVLCSLLWVTLLGQGVGLGDPQRSLPTPATLGFCDAKEK